MAFASKVAPELKEGIGKATQVAMVRYNTRYNNDLYKTAIEGKSSRYGNALIDEALAMCGDPHYKLSWRKWGAEARAFLAEFLPVERISKMPSYAMANVFDTLTRESYYGLNMRAILFARAMDYPELIEAIVAMIGECVRGRKADLEIIAGDETDVSCRVFCECAYSEFVADNPGVKITRRQENMLFAGFNIVVADGTIRLSLKE